MNNKRYPNNDLRTSIVYPLYLVSKEIIRKYNEFLREYDITYTQYLILMYFFHEKKSNLKKVGSTLMLDSSTLTPLLKKLEKKGLLTRSKSMVDERNLQIEITEEGMALKPKLRRVKKKMKDLCDMSQEEVDTLHKVLFKLLDTLIDENEK